MAGVTRNQFTEAMKQDLYGYFWEAYPEKAPVYESLFDVVSSNSAFEQFTSAIGLGELLEKPEEEDIQTDAPIESYTIICANRSFARMVRFSYESVQDSKKIGNLLSTTVGSWGRAVPITKEKFYAKMFNNGALTSGHAVFNNTLTGVITDPTGNLIYDGQPFFSTGHKSKGGTTYSNYNSATALTHTNLKTVYNQYTVTNNRDERDEVIELTPDVLLLPPALKFTAQEILNSTLIPTSQDNTTNVLASIVQPQEWSYLTDADGWFLGSRKMGLMATNREEVSLDFWRDETNRAYYASIFTRFGGTPTNWRYWIANNIASS